MMKRILLRLGKGLAGLALMITALNVNTTCLFTMHQPKLPADSKKLSKF